MSFDKAMNMLNLASLVALMFASGLQVGIDDVLKAARDKALLLKAIFVNYGIIPSLALVLLRTLQAPPAVAAGFVILAVCPGAPIGPPLSKLAGGNLPASLTMMLVLSALSAFLSPMLLSILLPHLSEGKALNIDYLAIITALLLGQLLPFLAGLFCAAKAPGFAANFSKPLDRLSKAMFLLVLILITCTQSQAFAQVRLQGWLGMFILLSASLMLGYFSGAKDPATCIAAALSSGTRNGGVALLIALGNFPASPAVAAVVVYTVFSTFGALAFAGFCKHLSKRKDPGVQT